MTSEVSPSGMGKELATSSQELDLFSVLSGMIESIKDNPAQIRYTVYELVRIKLQWEGLLQDPPIKTYERRQLMSALDAAIQRVETISSQQDQLQALLSLQQLIESHITSLQGPVTRSREPAVVIDHVPLSVSERDHLPAFLTSTDRPPLSLMQKPARTGTARVLLVCVVAIFAAASYVILDGQFGVFRSQTSAGIAQFAPTSQTAIAPDPKLGVGAQSAAVAATTAAVSSQPIAARPQLTTVPVPDVYGVYAASNGTLYELEALPGRVPDAKVFMSAPINKPSHTTLPDGQAVFIVFRRDLAGNAPDRVAVRVIARVMRAMTFDAAGKAGIGAVGDAWTLRGTSYELRVAPLGGNPEMLVIRPDQSDFVFPAGRYALVLKGLAYDFTVAGAITDPAQCLERVEAVNGAFYSECRNP